MPICADLDGLNVIQQKVHRDVTRWRRKTYRRYTLCILCAPDTSLLDVGEIDGF